MTDAPLNILWIGVDQLRADTPGFAGNTVCRTPHLDALAQQSIAFDRCYSTTSLCTPARATMMTGRYAFNHGLITNADLYHAPVRELPDPSMLLHHRLAARGYRCGHVGKWHIGSHVGPCDVGFEGMNSTGYGNIRADADFNAYLAEHQFTYSITEPVYFNPDGKGLLAGVWDGPTESTPPCYLAQRTCGLLDDFAQSGEPFFLSCQFWGPHQPHLPSREFAGKHSPDDIEPWGNFSDDWAGKPAMIRRTHTDFFRALPREWAGWQHVIARYYDHTAMIDAQIGRIIAHLDSLGLTDRTAIVFTSDHGDMTGAHGGMNDKGYIYEEAHRVPLLLALPGSSDAGLRRDDLATNMDIFPSLLDALGMPDDSLDGRSLLRPARDAVLLEFHGIRFLYSQRAVITDDGWKYVFTPGDDDEVYDLNADPHERHNLLSESQHAGRIASLRDRLKQLCIDAGDPLSPAVCKFFGDWDTPTGQPEPSKV